MMYIKLILLTLLTSVEARSNLRPRGKVERSLQFEDEASGVGAATVGDAKGLDINLDRENKNAPAVVDKEQGQVEGIGCLEEKKNGFQPTQDLNDNGGKGCGAFNQQKTAKGGEMPNKEGTEDIIIKGEKAVDLETKVAPIEKAVGVVVEKEGDAMRNKEGTEDIIINGDKAVDLEIKAPPTEKAVGVVVEKEANDEKGEAREEKGERTKTAEGSFESETSTNVGKIEWDGKDWIAAP